MISLAGPAMEPGPSARWKRSMRCLSSVICTGISNVRLISDGSRPTLAQCFSNTPILCRYTSRDMPCPAQPSMLKMSPNRASVRNVRRSPVPPTMMGMCGFWWQPGESGACSSR